MLILAEQLKRKIMKVKFIDEYELIEMDRDEDGELTDFVIGRNVRNGYHAKISCVVVVAELLKGNANL